jgi:hypothetical protein
MAFFSAILAAKRHWLILVAAIFLNILLVLIISLILVF